MQPKQNERPTPDAPPAAGRLRSLSSRLLVFALPYWKVLSLGFLALAGASAIGLLFPYLIKEALNGSFGFQLERDLSKLVGALIALFALQSVFFFVRHYCFTSIGYRLFIDIRDLVFRAALGQDITFFDASRVGDLLNRLSSDAQLVQRALTINISVAIRYFLQVVAGFVLMFE